MGPSGAHLRCRGGFVVAACAGLLVVLGSSSWPPAASALDYRWANPVDGAWNVASNWSPTGVPSSPADSAYVPIGGGPFTITLDLNPSLHGMLLANPTTVLALDGHVLTAGAAFFNHGVIVAGAGQTSTLAGSFTNTASGIVQVEGAAVLQLNSGLMQNDGTIVVNLGEPAAAYLRPVYYLTLAGSGQVVLQDSTRAIVDSPAGWILTNGAEHTIQGAGILAAPLINHGRIVADRSGQPLWLDVSNKNNDGVLAATSGGRLRVANITVTNTGGAIRADGGMVCLENATVIGGALGGTDGGAIRARNTVTLVDLENSARLDVSSGAVTMLAGTSLVNDGILHVWDGGDVTATLRMAGHVTVSGSGAIVLGNGSLAVLDSPAGWWLTNAVGHEIAGTGVVSAIMANHGLVTADVDGQPLVLNGSNKTNDGTLQATAGGILRISGIGLNNAGGLVTAHGGSVMLDDMWVTGGALVGAGGSEITAQGAVTIVDVTHQGRLNLAGGSLTSLAGTSLVNDGIIQVWDGSGDATILRMAGHVTVSGGGAITLGSGTLATLDSPAGWWLINAVGHEINGTGVLAAPLTNHGRVSADLAGQAMVLSVSNKVNDGTLRATAGGMLRIAGIGVINTGGSIQADGGPVRFEDSWLTGGSLTSTDDAAITAAGTVTLDGVHSTGRIVASGGAVVQLAGVSMIDDGTILVHDGGESPTVIRMVGHVTVEGQGIFEMNDPTRAFLDSPGGWVLANGTAHAVRGAGVVSAPIINNGEVCADRDGETLVLGGGGKVNNGTFGARLGGRLKLEVVPANYNWANHRLTGGTWLAAGGGVVELPGCPIDTNAAAIVLDGTGSRVDLDGAGGSALAGLVRNAPEGSFTLRNDRDLTTAGGFANAGRLVIGRGSALTVSGPQFAQMPGGCLRFELAGREPTQYGLLAVAGQATIAGSIEAAAVDGFIPALGDSFVVMTFGSHTGDFANDEPLLVEGMALTPVWRPHACVLRVTGAVAVDDGPADTAPTRLTFAVRRARTSAPLLVLSLPEPATVDIAVFDLAGRRVASLGQGEKPAGVHEYPWPAEGRPASGVYLALARVRSGAQTASLTAKVLVLR